MNRSRWQPEYDYDDSLPDLVTSASSPQRVRRTGLWDFALWLLGGIVGIVVLFCLSAALGCGEAPPKVVTVEKVVRVDVPRDCAMPPYPDFIPVPPPTKCADMLCWPVNVVAALVENVDRLKTWAAETRALCEPASRPVAQ